jgi:hypothetical protein
MEQAFFRSVQGHVSLQPVTNEVNLGYWYRTLKDILMDLLTIGHRGILYSIFQEKKCDLLSEKYDKATCNKFESKHRNRKQDKYFNRKYSSYL